MLASRVSCADWLALRRRCGRGKQAAGPAAIAVAERAERVPDDRLIAGDDRAAEPRLDLLDDAEIGNRGAAEEIHFGIRTCRLDQAVAPELRRRRAIRIAAGERKALRMQYLVAGLVQEFGLVVGGRLSVGRDQDDAAS